MTINENKGATTYLSIYLNGQIETWWIILMNLIKLIN